MSPAPPPRPPIPWHRRLEARVLMGVTLVTGLALLAILAVSSRLVTNYASDRSADDLRAAREAFRRLIETRSQVAAAQVRLIVEQPVFRSLFPTAHTHRPTMDNKAEEYCAKLGASVCLIADANDQWLGMAGAPTEPVPAALADALAEARHGRSATGIIRWGAHLFLTIAEPALMLPGEVLATFTVGFELGDAMARELSLTAGCDVTFVCADDGRLCGSSLTTAPRAALAVAMTGAGSGGDETPTLRELGGASYVGAEWPLAGGRGRLVLLQDWTPTERTLANLHRAFLLVGLITFGVAVAGSVVIGRRLTRPLRRLADAADQMAGGNWTRQLPVQGAAEARVMAEAFNQMTVALRQHEEQLRQAQKMEAVGRLAGGVAHDFNNLLTGILGYADLLWRQLPRDSPLREDVDGIRKAGQSAAALTKELLAFSRKQVLQPIVLDLNGVVAGTENLLRRLIGDDITLELRLAPHLEHVKADRAQLEQVLLNLAVNARDAMPTGGRLTIATEVVDEVGDHLSPHMAGAKGRHVLLRVADSGHGMSPEVQARLFEPFFTTKDVGKGTGLGLSTVYGVVKQSAGYIWAESAVGRGSTFIIALPAVAAPVTAATARTERDGRTPQGSETVLLVEDNDAVRTLARDTLEHFGYRVVEASNGRDALQKVRGGRLADIAVLVTDLVMPLMGGRELAATLTRERQGLKVIFTSGYAADTLGPNSLLEADAHFLQKPFTPELLGQTVRDVLDADLVGPGPRMQIH